MLCPICRKDTLKIISETKTFYYEMKLKCGLCGSDYSPEFLFNKAGKLEKAIEKIEIKIRELRDRKNIKTTTEVVAVREILEMIEKIKEA